MGFWVVRKVVLTEDGCIDSSTAHFVAWSIWIVGAVMVLQCSMDPLLAAEVLICAIIVSKILRRIRSRFFRHLYKKLIKTVQRTRAPDLSPLEDAYDDFMNKIRSPDSSKFLQRRSKQSALASRNSPAGYNSSGRNRTRTPPSQLSVSDTYYSTFHETPERRKFSKEEWEMFTRDSTKKALEELVASPDFSKWAVSNAERITLTPVKDKTGNQSRRWLFWS